MLMSCDSRWSHGLCYAYFSVFIEIVWCQTHKWQSISRWLIDRMLPFYLTFTHPFWTVSAGCHIHRQARQRHSSYILVWCFLIARSMCVFRLLSCSSSTKNRRDGILCVKRVSLRILRKTLSVTQTCNGILECLEEQLLSWGVMSSEAHDGCWWTRLSSWAREQECLNRIEGLSIL